jgi:hypothetical protein
MTQQLTELGPQPKEHNYAYDSARYGLERLKAIKIAVESSHAEASYTSMKAADELELPDSLKEISVEAGGSGYSASVKFDLKDSLDYSKYSVSGSDATIVNGTVTSLRERIEHNALSRVRYIVNRDRFLFPICYVLIYLLVLAIIRFLVLMGVWGGVWKFSTGMEATMGDSLIATIIAGGVGWLPLGAFLKWLLPYFTYDEDRGNKNRKIVMNIFSILVGGLAVNLLYYLFRLMVGS